MRRSLLAALLLAAAPTLLLAQDDRDSRNDRDDWLDRCREQRDDQIRYCEERSYGARPDGMLQVDGRRNGGARITAWDRDSIDVVARVEARGESEREARQRARDVRVTATGSDVHADGPDQGPSEWAVTYIIRVPRRSDLRVTTHNGPIALSGVSGTIDLSAENGPVSIAGAGGSVHARATNGPLHVALTGERWRGSGLDAETRNGPAVLELPSRYSARVEAGTTNGPMNVDFPMTVQGRINRHIEVTLGDGGPPVRVVTTNGPLVVRRADDDR